MHSISSQCYACAAYSTKSTNFKHAVSTIWYMVWRFHCKYREQRRRGEKSNTTLCVITWKATIVLNKMYRIRPHNVGSYQVYLQP